MSRQLSALILEDDPDQQKLLQLMFKGNDIQTVFCESGLEAIKKLGQEHFDLLLTDFNVPELTGIEVILWARKYAPRTRSVLMSAIPLSLMETMTRELGNIPIYAKPLDLQKLSRDLLSYSHTGLSGKMTHVDLIDLIRVLLIDKVNRILKIACQLSGEEATLVLYQGQLSHVSLRNKQQAIVAEGAEAFYRVLNLRKAS